MSLTDRQIRVFDFKTGKVLKQYDESVHAAHAMQKQVSDDEGQEGASRDAGYVHLDDMEFGRRLAVERDIDTSSVDALGEGTRACTSGCTANVVFDESGQYILYGSLLGIKGKIQIV